MTMGGVLYYGRVVDLTVLPALSSIASEQASATEKNEKKCTQLLDYLATHDNARIRYHASDMVLKIYSDASYNSETNARSRVVGQFYLEASQIQRSQLYSMAHSISCAELSSLSWHRQQKPN